MTQEIDWSKYPNFSEAEFLCRQTGEIAMDERFLSRLQALRTTLGFPFRITSGYRSPQHAIEARKAVPGSHATGRAADIAVTNAQRRYLIVQAAPSHGFTGIGIGRTFVHLDDLGDEFHAPRPAMWHYYSQEG